ncbi:alpha/beta fold hydrolase [Rhodococcus aerolatus]
MTTTTEPTSTRPTRPLRGLPPEGSGVEVRSVHVRLHGHRVRYLTAGDGEQVLVLVHGLAGDADTWSPLLSELARHHTVIAPDLMGHGESDKPRGDYSTAAFAAYVRDLVLLLGHERVTVVGHSLGGGVAMQFSYLFPELTERLVLISSGGLGRGVNLGIRLATLPLSQRVIPLGANRVTAPLAQGAVRALEAAGVTLPLPVAEAVAGWVRMSQADAARSFVTTVKTSVDLWGQRTKALDRLYLARLLPVLVVVGDRDTVIPPHHSYRAAEITGGRLEVVPGAGHVPWWDDASAVARALLDFLATTEPGEMTPEVVREAVRAHGDG